MNNKFKEYLSVIQKDWMDSKVVAASYAAYIESKIQIASDIRNTIYQLTAYLEGLPHNDPLIREIANSNYSEDVLLAISSAIWFDVSSVINMCIPTNGGDLVQLKELLSKYASSILNNEDTVTCQSLNKKSVNLPDILDSLNNGIDLNFAISSALDGFANDKSPADYLSELSANLGDRFQGVSSYASKAFNVLRDVNINVVDKIRTLITPITEFDESYVEGDFIRNDVDTVMYYGVSPAVFWFDASLNSAEAVASLYIASMKLSWKITVGILQAVASVFVGIWNRFLRDLFITNDIVVNNDYNCDYINIPRSQYRVPLNVGAGDIYGYKGVSDILVKKFSYSSVNDQDIWAALFSDGYALDIPTKFGLIRLVKDGDTIVRQIYLSPNTPISSGDLIWLKHDGRTTTPVNSCAGKSIDDQFSILFINSTTDDINVEKNDIFYWRAFQTSIARMDFFLGLISTSCLLTDEDYSDKTCSKLFSIDGMGGPFGMLTFLGATDNSNAILGYLSPSSNYNLAAGFTEAQISLTRLDIVPSSDPTNADFLMLLAMNSVNVCDTTTSGLLAGIPYFSCWTLLAYLYSTTKYGMTQLCSQGGSIEFTTFFPYNRSNRNDFKFKYTLASDEYNREAFNKQLKLTATTAIVIAASFVIFKGVKALKSNALADVQKSQAALWSKIDDPSVSPTELSTLQENLYNSTKRYNRIFGVSSSLDGVNLDSSNVGVQSIIKLIK